MKFLIKTILVSFICLSMFLDGYNYNPNNWIELSKIYVTKNSPTQQNIIFVNTYTGVGFVEDNEWHIIDMSNVIPTNAKAIFLTGILIITHGNSHETADLHVFFRRHGCEEEYIYSGQVCENLMSGQRSTMSAWIPLSEDLKFEFKWTRTTFGHYPDNSAYGINLSLNAWAK